MTTSPPSLPTDAPTRPLAEAPGAVPRSLLVIAGWGAYPQYVLEGARAAGVGRIAVLGFRGSCPSSLRRSCDSFERIPLGSLTLFLERATAAGCESVIMAGQVHPMSLLHARFDAAARAEMARLPALNAHTAFGRVADLLSERGIRPLPASLFMGGHLPAPGVLTARAPDEREARDIRYGLGVALAIGDADIGQTVVVKDGVVLAVEAFEGTNKAIARGARLGGRGSVVAKAAKRAHDMRFDIPVVGLRTMALLRRRRVSALGIQAGRVILLEREDILAYADRHGIAIEAVDSGLPSAPTLPRASAVPDPAPSAEHLP